ncbi:MAG: NADH-quinone oxidoreductase subunit NuoF [Pseudomonadota bacterium]
MEKVITKHFDVPRMHELKVARQHGAYLSLKKILRMKPQEIVELVTASGLRGRGGAGFPTGKKWSFIPNNSQQPIYLVVNADEGEPGTFKDRAILKKDPHLLIEGMIIAAHAIGATAAYVYIRGEYAKALGVLSHAVDEARDAGFLKCEIIIHRGAGAYVCGEESALLNSIEGLRGISRIRPPYPVSRGLYGCPTVVNNVETIACLPFIAREGADAFRKMGTGESSGTKLVSVCGHVEKPGVYEIEMGLPFSSFISEEVGGVLKGKRLKAVIPGGVSVPVLTASEALTCTIDYESLEEAGSALGSGGMIVMNESASMPRVLADIARFFAQESCGQCTPCREGSGWISRIMGRMEKGFGRDEDLNLLMDAALAMQQLSLCRLARHLSLSVVSFVTKFRGEFEDHIRMGT